MNVARIPRDESERVQAAIIEAAVEEIANNGYLGLRIPEVAKKIGKTQGAVYGRFDDKHALALTALQSIRDELFVPQMEEVLASPTSPLDKLAELSAITATIAQDHPASQRMLARFAIEMSDETTPLAEEVRGFFTTFVQIIRGLLQQAAADDELSPALGPDPDLDAIAHVCVAVQLGLASMSSLFPTRVSYPQLEAVLRPIFDQGTRKPST